MVYRLFSSTLISVLLYLVAGQSQVLAEECHGDIYCEIFKMAFTESSSKSDISSEIVKQNPLFYEALRIANQNRTSCSSLKNKEYQFLCEDLQSFMESLKCDHQDSVSICEILSHLLDHGECSTLKEKESSFFKKTFMKAEELPLTKESLCQSLLKARQAREEIEKSLLYNAILKQNESEVRRVVKSGLANLNEKTKNGFLPLTLAVEKRNAAIAEILIDGGAIVQQNLRPSIEFMDERMVSLLLIHDPSIVHYSNAKEQTPLHLIVMSTKHESEIRPLLELILKKGGDVNRVDKLKKQTPIHYLLNYGEFDLAKTALLYQADPNKQDFEGNSYLHLAIINGAPISLIQTLMEMGADPNSKNNEGKSPLTLASTLGEKEIEELLLKRGAKLEVFDKSKNTFISFKIVTEEGSSLPTSNSQGHSQEGALELDYKKLTQNKVNLLEAAKIKGRYPSFTTDEIITLVLKGLNSSQLESFPTLSENQVRLIPTLVKKIEEKRKSKRFKRFQKEHLKIAEEYEKRGKLNEAIWMYLEVGTDKAKKRAEYLNSLLKEILREGKIDSTQHLFKGSTKPKKVELSFEKEGKIFSAEAILKGQTDDLYSNVNSEVFASLLNDYLGITVVPVTVKRKIGRQDYSLQYFWEGELGNLNKVKPEEGNDLYAFDRLTQNADRHLGNYFKGRQDDICGNRSSLIGIDHGALWNRGHNEKFIANFNKKSVKELLPSPRFILGLERLDVEGLTMDVLCQGLATEENLKSLFKRREELITLFAEYRVDAVLKEGKTLTEIYFNNSDMVRGNNISLNPNEKEEKSTLNYLQLLGELKKSPTDFTLIEKIKKANCSLTFNRHLRPLSYPLFNLFHKSVLPPDSPEKLKIFVNDFNEQLKTLCESSKDKLHEEMVQSGLCL